MAGGGGLVALRLGIAMVALQVSIGTLNDVLDSDHDVGRVPPKPIPSGRVRRTTAQRLWPAAAVVGLLLVIPSGVPTFVVAAMGLSIGYAYDRYAKGTAWSWLPFALGIPLLPVYAWLGTGQPLPSPFAVLIPCAVLAGAAIAIANASADLERDRESGVSSVATTLGLRRAWAVHVALIAVAAAIVLGSLALADPGLGPVVAGLVGLGIVIVGAGSGATVGSRRATPGQRERAWEIEAVGMAILATAWLVGLVG